MIILVVHFNLVTPWQNVHKLILQKSQILLTIKITVYQNSLEIKIKNNFQKHLINLLISQINKIFHKTQHQIHYQSSSILLKIILKWSMILIGNQII